MVQLTQEEADRYRESPVILTFDSSGFYSFPVSDTYTPFFDVTVNNRPSFAAHEKQHPQNGDPWTWLDTYRKRRLDSANCNYKSRGWFIHTKIMCAASERGVCEGISRAC